MQYVYMDTPAGNNTPIEDDELDEYDEPEPEPVAPESAPREGTTLTDDIGFLYPQVGDPDFAAKIAQHKEFADTPYDGEIRDIEQHSNRMCKEGFEIAPHQWFVKNFLSTNTPYNGMLLYAGLGTGKCMGVNSQIMMADGSIHYVQDIVPDDMLMGDDGIPRRVLSTTRGWDHMFSVSREGADTYVVNGAHILCLIAEGFPLTIDDRRWDVFGNTLRSTPLSAPPGDARKNIWVNKHSIVEISVDDYLVLPSIIKSGLFGYCADWEELWRGTVAASTDAHFAGAIWRDDVIPKQYAFATRDIRTEFLMGVIMSAKMIPDTSTDTRNIAISLHSYDAAVEIQTMARSIGLDCNICTHRGDNATICIKQRTCDPLLFPRRNNERPTSPYNEELALFPRRNRKSTPITIVKHNAMTDYYGFTLSGNGRYVLGDLTVTHNTCSAIGVAEDMREYLQKINADACTRGPNMQRIIVIATPSVQQNFKTQLFDESKLRAVNGVWDIQSCVGASLIKEVSPSDTALSVDKAVVAQKIYRLIRQNYAFKGYVKFRKEIESLIQPSDELTEAENAARATRRIRERFDNCLIIVDEVHNMRLADDDRTLATDEPDVDAEGAGTEAEGTDAGVGTGADADADAPAESVTGKTLKMFKYMVRRAENLKLMLLSATPMYNSHKEIVWIANLLNLNDRRPKVRLADVFITDPIRGNSVFVPATKGRESGAELLRRKITGYVSYVRSENPYTFPYRIYPADFAPTHSFVSSPDMRIARPTVQYDGAPIQYADYSFDLFVSTIGEYQEQIYNATIENLAHVHNITSQLLPQPREALTMTFPIPETIGDNPADGSAKIPVEQVVGKIGMARVMKWQYTTDGNPEWYDFKYVDDTHRIFHPEHIGKYSNKIAAVCDAVAASTGLVLIFSQFIDAGCVPMALALEEMGLTRYTPRIAGNRNVSGNLFSESHYATHPSPALDALTMQPRAQLAPGAPFHQAKYAIVSGNVALTPDIADIMRHVTHPDNKDGAHIKVVIISLAGAEGIDFKFVRQVHIIDPWFHMNRMEQIIGRGVRNLSHCALPFEKRNVEIYLHATVLRTTPEIEAVDVYMYRFAEDKARQIGEVSRLLKESAVDCIINHAQTNFSMENFAGNREIQMQLSSGITIPYRAGDRPMSANCDYQPDCAFSCVVSKLVEPANTDMLSTYRAEFANTNGDAIIRKIRGIFKDGPAFSRAQIVKRVNAIRQYPIEQIYQVLSRLVDDHTEHIVNRHGRIGQLINDGEYYIFQPVEITDPRASLLERTLPIDTKPASILLELRDASGKSRTTIAAEGIGEGCVRSIIATMWTSFREATTAPKIANVDARKRWSWYIHAHDVSAYLAEVHHIDHSAFVEYMIEHIFDSLMIFDKLCVLAALYNPERRGEFDAAPELEGLLRHYIDRLMVYSGDQQGIVLIDVQNNPVLYIRDPAGSWHAAGASAMIPNIDADGKDMSFATAVAERQVVTPPGPLFVGYFSCFKQTEMVCNILNMREIRNNHYKGSRIDQMSKNLILQAIDALPLTYAYDREALGGLYQRGLAVILELLMRHHARVHPGPNATFAEDPGFEIRVRGRVSGRGFTKLNI